MSEDEPPITSAPEPGEFDEPGIDELTAYLDRGRIPSDPLIDNSPAAQIALAALTRLRSTARSLFERETLAQSSRDDGWVAEILGNISLEARAGRDIPVRHESPNAQLAITEGAVRGMIRAAGDSVDGVLIGRCRLDGDVTVPGEPVRIRLEVSAAWGESIPAAAARVRGEVLASLLRHTELNIVAIDVNVHDVREPHTSQEEAE